MSWRRKGLKFDFKSLVRDIHRRSYRVSFDPGLKPAIYPPYTKYAVYEADSIMSGKRQLKVFILLTLGDNLW